MTRLTTLCYIRQGGKTLMLHRNKRPGDYHFGKYNGVGGKFEQGESPSDCLLREVKEETGLTLKSYDFKGIITFPGFDGENDIYTFLYTSNDFEGEIIDPDEGTLSWIPDEQIISLNLWDGDVHFLPWVFEDDYDNRHFDATFIYKDGKYESHSVVFYGGI